MVRIAILGARGYTARELLEILLRHPHADVTCLTTRDNDRPHVSEIHPKIAGRIDLRLENASESDIAERADCVFSCLPHAASAETVSQLLDRGLRVIDFSADYRLSNADVYAKWYGVTHPDPERLKKSVYGLPELFREEIKTADLIANPGCYPTSAILALAPLLKAGLIETRGIVVDSKSGVSGAGRNPKPNLHFPECNEGFSAYGVGTHRHMPEIDQFLTEAAGDAVEVVFTPHLVPMDRGILTTTYAVPVGDCSAAKIQRCLEEFYRDEPFVRNLESPPTTKQVAHTNYCDLFATNVRGRVVVISVIDNLIKGASGAAVQNFNLMHGFDGATALN